MIERLAITLVLVFLLYAAYRVLGFLHVRRMMPEASTTGVPMLLYFRSDSCAVCPAQGRIIDNLAMQWTNRLQIESVDAERDETMAARYNVFTLPTTILLDDGGRVYQVNYGLVDAQKLGRQLDNLVMKRAGLNPVPTQGSL